MFPDAGKALWFRHKSPGLLKNTQQDHTWEHVSSINKNMVTASHIHPLLPWWTLSISRSRPRCCLLWSALGSLSCSYCSSSCHSAFFSPISSQTQNQHQRCDLDKISWKNITEFVWFHFCSWKETSQIQSPPIHCVQHLCKKSSACTWNPQNATKVNK